MAFRDEASGECVEHPIRFTEGGTANAVVEDPAPCARVTLTMDGPAVKGGHILRLKRVEVVGRFAPA